MIGGLRSPTVASGNWQTISPSDSSQFVTSTRGVYVGGAGNLDVLSEGGQRVTFIGVLAGMYYPLCIKQVFTTTTATNLVGLF